MGLFLLVGSSFSTQIGKIDQTETVIDEGVRKSLQFTKRRFRDAQQTTSMLEAAFGNFTSSLQPVTVQTMQLLVGDKGLQFQFVGPSGEGSDSRFSVVFDPDTKQLRIGGGLPSGFCSLQHMTLDVNTLSSSHAPSDYRFWVLEPFVSAYLGGEYADQAYYLYARCRKQGETSLEEPDRFVISPTPLPFDEAGNAHYFMLVGLLGSEFENHRSWVRMYGYSELTPGQLVVDKIASPDGQTYFDIAGGEIGGRIVFSDKDGVTQTLVEGGKIRTGFIDAEEITAHKLLVSDATGSVSIMPQSGLQLFKTTDGGANYTKTAEFRGEEKGGLDEIIPNYDSQNILISEKSIPLSSPGEVIMAQGTVEGSIAKSVDVTLPPIWLIGLVTSTLQVPKPKYGEQPSKIYDARILVKLLFNKGQIGLLDLRIEFVLSNTSKKDYNIYTTTTLVDNTTYVKPARFKIANSRFNNVQVSVDYSFSSSWPSGSLLSGESQIFVKFSPFSTTPLTSQYLKVGSAVLNASFFGNGLIFSKATDQYVGMMASASGTQLEIRSGEQGTRLSSTGISRRKADGSWDNAGLLLGLSVSADGSITVRFGVKNRRDIAIDKSTTRAGSYKIMHYIGHSNYIVNLAFHHPAWNADRMLHVVEKTTDSVTIQSIATNKLGYDIDFDILFFGPM